ncbi:hypothetical protein GCK72_015960 [Caenorhabditis remanei]|uniref:EamA domain-containing protein n=1 Tax=Caenorhabditis remanei TaxID=31234 RepID=A0A6A5GYM1_CAERE|nr:hypothetical protein GCK72_015960 [Caenorhabditis remanei]KAF1759493.1 hypothetical protein GCK72_015960 [Caenorhabditis remanei]
MEKDTTLGIVCAVVSAITFGSTYVPLKWFHKGDGLYFQWVQSLGQLLVGVTVALTTTPAPIHPIAMLSGMFYSIGVVGWAVTRFGLFANPQQHPRSDWLNILGVVTVCVGGAIYAPIKHIPSRVRPAPWSVEEDYKTDPLVVQEVSCTRRIICLFLTIFVGFLYGNFLTPINYIIANEPGSHQDVRAYILSYCLGSFVTSTVIFFFYAIFKKNTPLVNAELSMPSIVSGILYGIAVTTFFMANQHLDQVIAYPILSKAPGIIVSLWAIFLFKEIQGKKDIIQLYIGIGVTLLGIAFISLSKVEF